MGLKIIARFGQIEYQKRKCSGCFFLLNCLIKKNIITVRLYLEDFKFWTLTKPQVGKKGVSWDIIMDSSRQVLLPYLFPFKMNLYIPIVSYNPGLLE